MKVTEKDLIGELGGIPIEITQAMVNEQVRQGNEANIKLFQDSIMSGVNRGGFTWDRSLDGIYFWDDILRYKKFELFFEKYPRKTNLKNMQTQSGVDYLIINPE